MIGAGFTGQAAAHVFGHQGLVNRFDHGQRAETDQLINMIADQVGQGRIDIGQQPALDDVNAGQRILGDGAEAGFTFAQGSRGLFKLGDIPPKDRNTKGRTVACEQVEVQFQEHRAGENLVFSAETAFAQDALVESAPELDVVLAGEKLFGGQPQAQVHAAGREEVIAQALVKGLHPEGVHIHRPDQIGGAVDDRVKGGLRFAQGFLGGFQVLNIGMRANHAQRQTLTVALYDHAAAEHPLPASGFEGHTELDRKLPARLAGSVMGFDHTLKIIGVDGGLPFFKGLDKFTRLVTQRFEIAAAEGGGAGGDVPIPDAVAAGFQDAGLTFGSFAQDLLSLFANADILHEAFQIGQAAGRVEHPARAQFHQQGPAVLAAQQELFAVPAILAQDQVGDPGRLLRVNEERVGQIIQIRDEFFRGGVTQHAGQDRVDLQEAPFGQAVEHADRGILEETPQPGATLPQGFFGSPDGFFITTRGFNGVQEALHRMISQPLEKE